MKRVLIVSPRFPPTNAADHQRVRMALPYLREFGWDPVVLGVLPTEADAARDDLLMKTVPRDVRVIRTGAVPRVITRLFRVNTLSGRAGWFLRQRGSQLLRSGDYDLVFFSTTVFPAMTWGAHWLREHGVPYVLDFQDPWLSDYYDRPGASRPPGGKLKYGIAKWRARRGEPVAVRDAARIISVSPSYPGMLRTRYPELDEELFDILPFGAPEHDFELLDEGLGEQSIFDPNDGSRHWVYTGRGGGDMRFALEALFSAIAADRRENPARWERVRLHFIGTSYAPGRRATASVLPVAEQCGVADIVQEHPQRVPWFTALRCLRDADKLMIVGSDDASYTASKLYPYILARRPLLGVFHERSSVVSIMGEIRAGTLMTFDGNATVAETAAALRPAVARFADSDDSVTTDFEAFAGYSARAMTQKLCAIFDRALGEQRR